MDLLRIATAGSVDDGKSTLIGRLLYETGSLKEDQLKHIEEKSASNGLDHLDFSWLQMAYSQKENKGLPLMFLICILKQKKDVLSLLTLLAILNIQEIW